jgi:Peptidase family M50
LAEPGPSGRGAGFATWRVVAAECGFRPSPLPRKGTGCGQSIAGRSKKVATKEDRTHWCYNPISFFSLLLSPGTSQSHSMNSVCSVCGARAEGGTIFREERKSFGVNSIYYCPACWDQRERRQRVALIVTLAILGVVVAGVAIFATDSVGRLGWIFVNLALVALFEIGLVLPHELGHAVAARLVGWRLLKIVVGLGPRVFEMRVAGLPIEWRAIPIGGWTLASRTSRESGLRDLLFVLGGPCVNVCLFALLLFCAEPRQLFTPDFELGLRPLTALALSNAAVLLINLLPHSTSIEAGGDRRKVASDGLQLLRILLGHSNREK